MLRGKTGAAADAGVYIQLQRLPQRLALGLRSGEFALKGAG